ncbi:carboxypeptidase-like regulatory domain-containing protein [Flavobacteriaceae bacterium TP-CH-4]|uniref:Carboxypeptidase-like regulatory domain-containing protein n=1 Tax=Pelagihabitans pacificus TaxID=2696054 RepID=A0A967B1L4_9FLAO|nr:carboxypeptidase-like regulatory domain-containing protein [Pelagihabitans pacificus]NHF60416.1 carboxypeptidase-like regulatory domain-containing protein [Pelagihabitans pacificus]
MQNIFLLVVLVFSLSLYSQNKGVIKGNIIDLEANGEPMLFANVQIKNTDWATQTNFNGNFELSGIEVGEYVLEVNFLGYETLEVPVNVTEDQITRVDKGMTAKTLSMVELTQKNSKAVTTAVASIEKEE